MSPVNAALTPRHRLRIAQLIVDDGWPVAHAAAFFHVAWPTAKRWADRYVAMGAEGMTDRSSRPHRMPNRTPPQQVRRVVALRWRQRLGPVAIGAQLNMPASTVHAVLTRCRVNRLRHIDVRTGEVVRRYEHDKPGAMIHVDVKKLGNIPDGGGHRYVGRQQGQKNRAATPDKPRNVHHNPKIGTAFVHTVIDDHSRVAYAEIHDDETAAPRSPCCAVPSPGTPAASPWNWCCRTTGRPTSRTLGATCAPSSASRSRRPAPTGPRPTARSNGSTAPSPTAGPSVVTTRPKQEGGQRYRPGSTPTITTGPTPPSEASHPSPG